MSNDEIRMTNQNRMTNDDRSSFGLRHSFVILISSFGILSAGCFPKPNAANIALRKEVQGLNDKITDLQARHEADRATIDRLSADRTIQTLPPDKLEKLFTTSAIKFKNLTVGEDLDPNTPGDEGFKVGITPVDEFGDEFKSAGSFKIELFDLADKETRLGEWTLSTTEARTKWLSSFVFDGYVLQFPWQTVPTHEKLLVKATFTDELNGRVFEAKADLTIKVPGK